MECRRAESEQPDAPTERRAWEPAQYQRWLRSTPNPPAMGATAALTTACGAGNEVPAPPGQTAYRWCPTACSSRGIIGWGRTNFLPPIAQWSHTRGSHVGSAPLRSASRAALGAARATPVCPRQELARL